MKLWKKGLALLMVLCMTAGMAMTAHAAADSVPIDATTFPDPAFLLWVEGKDTDGDGSLSPSERSAVTSMDLRKLGIQDLSGLEWFDALEKLNCSENDLLRLELPSLPALTSLTCNENPRLETLILSGAPALEQLYCFHSNLSQLDLHDVPNLIYLAWGGSPLQELDLSGNPNLHTLHVLGGDLSHADLSHNEALDTLLWNHTRIEALDLSHQPNLTYLNCTDNQITALDLSSNTKLETVYAGSNRLLAIRLPENSVTFCELTGQSPVSFQLPAGENSIPLLDFAPWIDSSQLSQLSGGTLNGDRIQLDAPNQLVTYRYEDGIAVLDAVFSVTGENAWTVPLSIADWTYGEPPALPTAQPAFGHAVFSYGSSPQGPFQSEPPTHAGTWYVRAQVEATAQYQGLEAVTAFQIKPAVPEYLVPATKSATYGDYLADVSLEPHFFWENGSLRVGNAGTQTHFVFYIPEDFIDYQVVQHIPVLVNVAPYDGTQLPIPPISSRAEAEALVIRHGDWVLQKGIDYTTELEEQGDSTQFTIRFQGNYTGTLIRSFSEHTGSGGGSPATPSFRITAQASSGGTITPSGNIWVKQGATPLFTMQADEGYRLHAVLVDGTPVAAETTYRFAPVSQNHTISAQFVPLDTPLPPDETGVSELLNTRDHNAYVSGYPGNRFGPDDFLTRAQAAQIFYSLLQDQDVPITAGFSDVPNDAWYAKAVNTLASLGKVAGVGENRFLPDQAITRAEFAAMAMGFADYPSTPTCSFPDVSPDAWYYTMVASAAEYGWISGYPDGCFGPMCMMTRSQAAVVVNRMLGRQADPDFISSHEDVHTFLDVQASHWAYYDICEAANPHSYRKTGQAEIWDALL